MRTSVFVRPTEVHYITLHEDLYRICRGNACAAMLMDYFIREHDRRLWEARVRQDGPEEDVQAAAKWGMTIQVSVAFLCDILVWSYSKNTISDSLKNLCEWGMINMSKERPKGREYDRRHYLTVDQQVVQGLFSDLAKQHPASKIGVIDFPKLGNQLPEVGKSVEKINLVNERGEKQPSDSADGEPRETASPQGKPPVSHPKSSAPPPPTPRQRNLLGETMLEVCWGIADYTKATAAQWSLASKTLKELKQVQPDLTPEMLREFAARMRREWDGRSFTPAAIAKHWRPIPASGNGIPESHPFPGSARVTTAELVARFPSGPEQAKWRRRLMEEGRY